jgi:hypothetical protein
MYWEKQIILEVFVFQNFLLSVCSARSREIQITHGTNLPLFGTFSLHYAVISNVKNKMLVNTRLFAVLSRG